MNKDPRSNGHAAAREDEYFKREDSDKIAQLRTNNQAPCPLELALGINDPAILTRLSELGVTADNSAALRLLPLFAVAWSDGNIHRLEARVLLAEVEVAEISKPSAANDLIKCWMLIKPDPDFEEAWRIYARALCAKVGKQAVTSLRESLLRRGRFVAEAAGGIAGIGSVSRSEQRVLDELSYALAD